ncbi:MAG: putative toxin-antitoxin system toxin component, PIN family [Kiritimatiellia bacterium]|jgi:putative PIN family toxin of toxin-antitoxin system
MIVVLDANVLIAAVAGRGLCEAVLEHCLEEHEIICSSLLVQDVHDKLLGKIKVPRPVVQDYCNMLQENSRFVEPAPVPLDACRDPDDLHLLGLADAGGAVCLVTGDKDLLVLESCKKTQIVTPRQFWDCMR